MRNISLEELRQEMAALTQKKESQAAIIELARQFNEDKNPRFYGKKKDNYYAKFSDVEMRLIRAFGDSNLFRDLAGDVSIADLIRVEDGQRKDLGLDKRLELLETIRNIDINKRFAAQEKVIQDRIEELTSLNRQNLVSVEGSSYIAALSKTKEEINIEEVKKCFDKSSKFEKLEASTKREIGQYYNANKEKVGVLLKELGSGKYNSLTTKGFLAKVIRAAKEVARVGQYLEVGELKSVIEESVKKGMFSKNFDIDKFMDLVGKITNNKIRQEYINMETMHGVASPSTSEFKSGQESRSPTFSEERKSRRESFAESTSKKKSSISSRGSFTESTSKEKLDITR